MVLGRRRHAGGRRRQGLARARRPFACPCRRERERDRERDHQLSPRQCRETVSPQQGFAHRPGRWSLATQTKRPIRRFSWLCQAAGSRRQAVDKRSARRFFAGGGRSAAGGGKASQELVGPLRGLAPERMTITPRQGSAMRPSVLSKASPIDRVGRPWQSIAKKASALR